MKNNITHEIIDFCDKHVRYGNDLKITWEGGNDSGFVELKLNGIALTETDENVSAIIQRAYSELGYGSFAGDFSTSGEATYDYRSKSFIGIDHYAHSESDIMNCDLLIMLPDSIWFDTLGLSFQVNNEGSIEQMDVNCIIKNGPRLASYETTEKMVAEQLEKGLSNITNGISNLDYIWEEKTLERSQLQQVGNQLAYNIKELTYQKYVNDQHTVNISLNN